MKIPKYIDEALRKRSDAAYRFLKYDFIVSEWICNNGLEEYIEPEDFYGGVEAIVNPDDSADRIREAILNKENT